LTTTLRWQRHPSSTSSSCLSRGMRCFTVTGSAPCSTYSAPARLVSSCTPTIPPTTNHHCVADHHNSVDKSLHWHVPRRCCSAMLSRLSSPRIYHTASTMRTTASMATTAVIILNDVVMHCNHALTLNNHRPRTHQQRHLQYHRLVELLHHHDVHKCIADRWPHETTKGCIASQRYASMHAPKLMNHAVTRFYIVCLYICGDSTVPGEQCHRLTPSDFQTVYFELQCFWCK